MRAQPFGRDEIDRALQHRFEVEAHLYEVQADRRGMIELHQDVHIAALIGCSSGERPENVRLLHWLNGEIGAEAIQSMFVKPHIANVGRLTWPVKLASCPMPKEPSAAEALAKARAYCARQERAQQEVRDKLYAWQVPAKEIEAIISRLIGEGFLNEARFAEHFAVSKSRQKGWGLRKIEAALKQKQVSEPCIRAALKSIDRDEQSGRLQGLMSKRWDKEKEPHAFRKRQRVVAYFLRRGFAMEEVERAIQAVEGHR